MNVSNPRALFGGAFLSVLGVVALMVNTDWMDLVCACMAWGVFIKIFSCHAWVSVSLLMVVSSAPFLLSAAALEKTVVKSGVLYELASCSPLPYLCGMCSDPWLSEFLYIDSPFHYILHPVSGSWPAMATIMGGVWLLLEGVLGAEN